MLVKKNKVVTNTNIIENSEKIFKNNKKENVISFIDKKTKEIEIEKIKKGKGLKLVNKKTLEKGETI